MCVSFLSICLLKGFYTLIDNNIWNYILDLTTRFIVCVCLAIVSDDDNRANKTIRFLSFHFMSCRSTYGNKIRLKCHIIHSMHGLEIYRARRKKTSKKSFKLEKPYSFFTPTPAASLHPRVLLMMVRHRTRWCDAADAWKWNWCERAHAPFIYWIAEKRVRN